MPNVGPMELVLVLAIALIVLGPKKLPEVGRSLGKGLREFKDSVSGATAHEFPRAECSTARSRHEPPSATRRRAGLERTESGGT